MKESGYDGRPVVVIHVTDYPYLGKAGLVTRQRLETIGFKVDLKVMGWSKNLAVRARKDPPNKGGWNVLHTWFPAADVIIPLSISVCPAPAQSAWFGWPSIPSSRS